MWTPVCSCCTDDWDNPSDSGSRCDVDICFVQPCCFMLCLQCRRHASVLQLQQAQASG